jgi:hypothetical protein
MRFGWLREWRKGEVEKAEKALVEIMINFGVGQENCIFLFFLRFVQSLSKPK